MHSDHRPRHQPPMKPPLILFGAFDRHNLGDLLFPHIVAALLPERQPVFAGLMQRDLRRFGGHRVQAIADIACNWGDQPADLIHVGGELLDCDLYQATVMLQTPANAAASIARYDTDPAAGLHWAQQQTGLPQQCGYLADKRWFRQPRHFIYNGIGGAGLTTLPVSCRAEVLQRLSQAEHIGVREQQTLATLAAAGIASELQPDCAALLPQLFRPAVVTCGRQGEVANVRKACPNGYLAIQFASELADDQTLATIAAQLRPAARQHRLALVFFRVGAAPWHDELQPYRRLAAHLAGIAVHLFESLNIWDIVALLAHARCYCGTSLHGRIVANGFGIPAVSLAGNGAAVKVAANLQMLQPADGSELIQPGDLAAAIERAMASPASGLAAAATQAATACRRGCERWLQLLR